MPVGITSTRRPACVQFFAIQHVPTGAYLPQERTDKFEELRFTHVEPDLDAPPALYTTHGGATRSMQMWLRGKLRRLTHAEGLYAGETVVVGRSVCSIEPVPERNPEHMAVVTMLVVERKQPR